MDKKFARSLVAYIEKTSSLLEKYAETNERLSQENEILKEGQGKFQEKLAEAIEVMANDGRVPKEYSQAIFNSLKDSPEKVAEFLFKVNDQQPTSLGEASNEMNSESQDAIVKFCFDT